MVDVDAPPSAWPHPVRQDLHVAREHTRSVELLDHAQSAASCSSFVSFVTGRVVKGAPPNRAMREGLARLFRDDRREIHGQLARAPAN